MTLAYFCLASLALLPSSAVASTDESLSALEVMLKPAQIQGFRDWVYEQQMPAGGFRGSDSLAAAGLSAEQACTTDPANVIQTYTALCVLGLLGDDYSRLDRPGLKRFLGECQNEDGSWVPHPLSEPSSLRDKMQCSRFPFQHSFSQFPGCEEPGDPRLSYSAFAVASMLDEWDFIDVDQGLAFLECCRVRTGHRNLCFRESSKCASRRATKALMLKDPVSKPTVRPPLRSESSRDSPRAHTPQYSRSYLLCHRSLLSRVPTPHHPRAGRPLALARRPTSPTAATFAVRNRLGFRNRGSYGRNSIARRASCRCAHSDRRNIRRRGESAVQQQDDDRCRRFPGSGQQTD